MNIIPLACADTGFWPGFSCMHVFFNSHAYECMHHPVFLLEVIISNPTDSAVLRSAQFSLIYFMSYNYIAHITGLLLFPLVVSVNLEPVFLDCLSPAGVS